MLLNSNFSKRNSIADIQIMHFFSLQDTIYAMEWLPVLHAALIIFIFNKVEPQNIKLKSAGLSFCGSATLNNLKNSFAPSFLPSFVPNTLYSP